MIILHFLLACLYHLLASMSFSYALVALTTLDIYIFFFFNDTATTEIYTDRSSAASDVYKRQAHERFVFQLEPNEAFGQHNDRLVERISRSGLPALSLIHISEPTRPY